MAYKSDSFFRARNDFGMVPVKLLEDSRLHKIVNLYSYVLILALPWNVSATRRKIKQQTNKQTGIGKAKLEMDRELVFISKFWLQTAKTAAAFTLTVLLSFLSLGTISFG